jgi:pantothenate kinase
MTAQSKIADVQGLVDTIHGRDGASRALTAIAGPPGSGKSTLAESMAAQLNRATPGTAVVFPMDGYHYDDAVLEERGLRARKGAPETFDVAGLRHMLLRLCRNEEPEIAIPLFDRELEIARAGARLIPHSVRYLIVEGNYLLLDRLPWSDLHTLFATTIMIQLAEETLRQRLMQRWLGYGLTAEEASAKVETNDLPNGRLVANGSVRAEFIVGT